MSLWDWLFGGKKYGDFDAGPPIAPPAIAPPPPPPPGMQQIQLTAPAAVPTSYGIQRAIELMRALPVDDDTSLVLRVVRKTLQSTGVSLEEIIRTAKEREAAVVKGIESDRTAIEQLEIQITTRRANITRLEGDLDETREVRARIEEALASETKVGPALSPDDILRIRAEAGHSKPPPLPKVDAPAPTAAIAAAAKKAAPVVASKPPPKLPSAMTSPSAPKRDTTPRAPEPKAEAKIEPKIESKIGGRSEPMSSIPDLGEIDDGFGEPVTAEIEVPVVRGKMNE